MGGVEVPQAPMGVGCGEEYPTPHWRKGLGRGLCPLGPSPENFSYFFALNTIF